MTMTNETERESLPKHWVPIGLLGANATFQRAAREYAEEYASLAISAARVSAEPQEQEFLFHHRYFGDVTEDQLKALSTPPQPTERSAELEAVQRDAQRYRFLSSRLLAADFDWQESGESVLVFSWPDSPVNADCDETIDAAIAAAPQKGEK